MVWIWTWSVDSTQTCQQMLKRGLEEEDDEEEEEVETKKKKKVRKTTTREQAHMHSFCITISMIHSLLSPCFLSL